MSYFDKMITSWVPCLDPEEAEELGLTYCEMLGAFIRSSDCEQCLDMIEFGDCQC